jgi:hypothetical protein
MPAKLFVTAPHYLAEQKLRSYLELVQPDSITYAPSVHGAIWLVEFSTAEDAQKAREILTAVVLENNHTLSVVSADSSAAKTLDELFTAISVRRSWP